MLRKILLPLLAFCTSALFSQNLLQHIPLVEQVNQSDLVVEGRVLSKESFSENNHIFTKNIIEVSKAFKGEFSGKTITVVTKGGFYNFKGEIVNPSLNLHIDDFGVFVLSKREDGMYVPYASSQSFYKYDFLSGRVVGAFENYTTIANDFTPTLKLYTFQESRVISSNVIFEVENAKSNNSTSAISNFSPSELSAGTSSVLTINGSGFGSTKGTVYFRNANDGGSTTVATPATLITSWTDTQINVKVPYEAGSGVISIKPSGGTTVSSSQSLKITYSHINLSSDGTNYYQTVHLDRNTAGGYTLVMNSTFNSNTIARQAFERALNSWKCATGINWTISPTTSTSTSIADDGTNLVTFATLGAGVLAECTNYYSGAYNSNNELIVIVTGYDVGIKSSVNWNYTSSAPSASQYDFESTILHELGHASQLHHVIDASELMHWFATVGSQFRIITSGAMIGGNAIMARNLSINLANVGTKMNPYNTSLCATSVTENAEPTNMDIYPNPANDFITIDYTSAIEDQHVSIFDIQGNLLLDERISANNTKIDVRGLASGLYILKVSKGRSYEIKKFVKS